MLLRSLTLIGTCAVWLAVTAATAPNSELTPEAPAAPVTAQPLNRYGVEAGSTAKCATDTDCSQYAWDYGMGFDEMTPEAYVWDRSKPYGWAALDEQAAAQTIAARIDSGMPYFEDWTWEGMPAVVGRHNDDLLDQWEAAGRPDASGWLDSYAAQDY